MAQKSPIGWTDETDNWGVRGCTRKDRGCLGCYAVLSSYRQERMREARGQVSPYAGVSDGKNWTGQVKVDPKEKCVEHIRTLPRRKGASAADPVFTFSIQMADFLHPAVPMDTIQAVLFEQGKRPDRLFQNLTHRPERITELVDACRANWGVIFPHNVALGATAVDVAGLETALAGLRQWPGPTFLSCEPMLEDLSDALDGALEEEVTCCGDDGCEFCDGTGVAFARYIDQVVLGYESGGLKRGGDPDWIRRCMAVAKLQGVPVFVKQLGTAWAAETPGADRKGENWDFWPEDLRLQEHIDWRRYT